MDKVPETCSIFPEWMKPPARIFKPMFMSPSTIDAYRTIVS